MLLRSINNLNSIINQTANSMALSMYQNTRAVVLTNGVNIGYNTVENKQNLRGLASPITCGISKCGSESDPFPEYCKLK